MPTGYNKNGSHNGVNTRFKKGMKHTDEWKKMMSERMKGNTYGLQKGSNIWVGKKHNKEAILKMSLAKIGKNLSEETKRKISEANSGSKNYRWKEDRSKLCRITKQGERRTSAYFYWRKQVWTRDNFKCKIGNQDCNGRIEAHHILNWIDYPKLRFEINNGITLCQAHHPRKRAEEKRLEPIFKALVSVSN